MGKKYRPLSLILMISLVFLIEGYCVEGSLAKPLPKRYTNSLGMEFVLIPQGFFEMGTSSKDVDFRFDETKHKVTISKAFYMQTTEVTIGQWRMLMGKSMFSPKKGGPDMPVTRVSWHDVQRFITKLNRLDQGIYCLPSEAQWEYACRAKTETAFYTGNEITCSQAMFGNNSLKDSTCIKVYEKKNILPGQPAKVRTFPPNAFGLYDMHGNVWEWCDDWYGPYGKEAVTDPKGPSFGDYKVRRGGSWYRNAARLRSANRNYANPDSKYSTLGFRLVRQAD